MPSKNTSVNGGLVSIAHKPTVAAFHNQQWTLVKKPGDTAGLYEIKMQPINPNA